MTSRTFTNEAGERVVINVEDRPLGDANGVFISIGGPESDTENHITLLETQVMYEELGKVLRKKCRK